MYFIIGVEHEWMKCFTAFTKFLRERTFETAQMDLRKLLQVNFLQNEKQVHMVCQKVGQILQFFCPPASSFVCVKFTEPVDAILARLKAEVPFSKCFISGTWL